jgi:hypothetical protein
MTRNRDRFRAGKRLWNPSDDALLRRRYAHEPTAAIATKLRRSIRAVYVRARLLGLAKSAAYLAKHCRLQRGSTIGAQFRFQKGHVPANKGLKRPAGWGPGRMKETQFRTGVPSWRNMPIGGTRAIDGYLYRKVSDVPNVPWTVNWTLEHHRIWAAVHGPVPKGFALIFRNGDRTDIRLDNLQLLTRRELMARNTVHNLPRELASTIQLLGALHRQLRRRTSDAESSNR